MCYFIKLHYFSIFIINVSCIVVSACLFCRKLTTFRLSSVFTSISTVFRLFYPQV